ncbi:hypothetical protein [Nonomuraea sp. NPDC003804]
MAERTPRSEPRTPAVQPSAPGPAPDPCATFHDLRRTYCYDVLDRLTP